MPPSFGRTAAAKLNTKKKPHMSVTVVSSGLETRAGSSFNRLSTRGSMPPRVTETSVLAANAPPTTRPSHGFPFQKKATPPSSRPSTRPLMMPTRVSFASTQSSSPGRTRPKESSRMETATAWLPEQPLMSLTMGRKTARVITAAKGILIQGDHAGGDDIEHDVHAQPGQTASGAGQQRHGPELLAADDTAQTQKCFCLALVDRLLDGARQHHADQPSPVVHHRHPEQVVFLEKLLERLKGGVVGYAERRSDHHLGQPGLPGGKKQVVHAQHAGQPALPVNHVKILHMVIDVFTPIGLQVVEHILDRIVGFIDQKLGNHQAAGAVRGIRQQHPGFFGLLAVHLRPGWPGWHPHPFRPAHRPDGRWSAPP